MARATRKSGRDRGREPAAGARPTPSAPPTAAPPAPADRVPGSGWWRYPVVGLWLAFVGYMAGGMISMLVAKIASTVQGCTPPDGFPACNMDTYFQVGTTVGLLTLPAVVLWRMWLNDRAARRGQR